MYEQLISTMTDLDGADVLAPLITGAFRGRIAIVSSFGAESAVLLHMVASIDRSVPVISLDTGKLFWETVAYRSRLISLLGLTDIRIIKPDPTSLRDIDADGPLYQHHPDRCCRIRKVEPLDRALTGFAAWISGRKRAHGGLRADIPVLQELNGRLKIEPLAHFTADDVETYLDLYDLPRHPLVAEGYRSIGCAPCTVKGGTAGNPRAGRWAGQQKTECGIHWSLNGEPIQVDRRTSKTNFRRLGCDPAAQPFPD